MAEAVGLIAAVFMLLLSIGSAVWLGKAMRHRGQDPPAVSGGAGCLLLGCSATVAVFALALLFLLLWTLDGGTLD